jgi:adenylate kinase family enzyme
LNRITILGSSGAGKTTLGEELAARLGYPFVDLDALGWDAGWTMPPPDVMNARVSAALTGGRWITAGNYSRVRPIVWGRADTVVWLDYPLTVIYPRLFRRTVRRVISREELWGGNRETFRAQFMSRESLFLYVARSHQRKKREFKTALAQPAYAHLRLLRFHSPQETAAWLANLPARGD